MEGNTSDVETKQFGFGEKCEGKLKIMEVVTDQLLSQKRANV